MIEDDSCVQCGATPAREVGMFVPRKLGNGEDYGIRAVLCETHEKMADVYMRTLASVVGEKLRVR